MNIYQEKRRARGHHCPGFSSSKASTQNKTEVTDSRVVGGDNSVNLSANDSTVSVIATDHGAVSGGLELGSMAITAATQSAAQVGASSASMFEGALGAVSDANERLALAYQSGNAGEQTQLKYAGFVVVGLAALAFVSTRLK